MNYNKIATFTFAIVHFHVTMFQEHWICQIYCSYICCSAAQWFPTLCNPMDCSFPGSSVHGIFQARIWSGLPFTSPGDIPDPEIEPTPPTSPALVGGFFTTELPGKLVFIYVIYIRTGFYMLPFPF